MRQGRTVMVGLTEDELAVGSISAKAETECKCLSAKIQYLLDMKNGCTD
jgi:hypothetical protein